jgi:hypothetical protein
MVLRILLLAALAGAVLAPFTIVDASSIGVVTRAQKQKPQKQKPTTALTSKSRHGRDKVPNSAPSTPTKKQDEEVTPNRGTIDAIGTVARGQEVTVHATALRNGESCALQIFYADKPAKIIRDITPDSKKRCEFTFTVPDRPEAVGEAKAKLILTKASSSKPDGEARQVFSVT